MSQYQNFVVSGPNSGDNNQFTSDVNQNGYIMFNNLLQNPDIKHQIGNGLVYAVPGGNYNIQTNLQNSFQQQYFNNLNNINLVPMTNGSQMGIYVNNQAQFGNVDNYINNMSQFIPLQNLAQGINQGNSDDLNKNNQHRPPNNRARKRSYNDQVKPVDSTEMEYDHKNRPLIYSCKECPRRFSMNSRLNTHMRCHNGERPHVCMQCNFAFTQKSYLVRHAAVHKEERPYQCHACKKTYKHYGSLANHRKTHKNGRKETMIDTAADNSIGDCKAENDCSTEVYHNSEYIFGGQPKQEPQQNYMPTDLSTNMFQSSDGTLTYLERLNQISQDPEFYGNTDQTDVPVSSQQSSNQASTFTV